MPQSFHPPSLGYIFFIIVSHSDCFGWEAECWWFVTLKIIFVSKKGKGCVTFNLWFCRASHVYTSQSENIWRSCLNWHDLQWGIAERKGGDGEAATAQNYIHRLLFFLTETISGATNFQLMTRVWNPPKKALCCCERQKWWLWLRSRLSMSRWTEGYCKSEHGWWRLWSAECTLFCSLFDFNHNMRVVMEERKP